MVLETLASTVSVVAALAGIAFGWITYRRKSRREDDVFNWANEAIEAMHAVWLLCSIGTALFSEDEIRKRMAELAITTSVLIEKGRLLFKNKRGGSSHLERPVSYQGYRPNILDYMVPSHQVACNWVAANESDRIKMQLVAEDCIKHFIGLAQEEVGRKAAKAKATIEGGKGRNLKTMMGSIEQNQIDVANKDKYEELICVRSSFRRRS